MFKKENNTPLIATIVACTVLICGSLIFLGTQLSSGGITAPETERTDSLQEYFGKVEADVDNNDAILGDKNSNVKIVEYSDYQCPFCRSYFLEAYQQVKNDYVDTGMANVTFKDFPLEFHADAIYTHNAAECARKVSDDETYFAFHDAIFEAQGPVMNGTVTITDKMITNIAKDLDVNTKEYNKCVEDNEFYPEITADYLAAAEAKANRIAEIDSTTGEPTIRQATAEEQVGVNATPTIFVNDIKIVGAQPYEVFKLAIDSELRK